MKTIFKMINSKKKNTLSNTLEYQFFAKNARILSKYEGFYKLRSFDEKTFKIIQSNILIRAMENKNIIEEIVSDNSLISKEELLQKLIELNRPCFISEGNKIYLPIYSKGLNFIYIEEPSKLLEFPYCELKEEPISSCIDLFDVYNLELYDSSFTNLVKIDEDKTSGAFYHKEFETIYIINNQGRLDLSIRLFDKHLVNKSDECLIERLKEVVSCFYKGDRDTFIKSLFLNKFISLKRYKMLKKSKIKK